MRKLKKRAINFLLVFCFLSTTVLFGEWTDAIKVSEGSNPDMDLDWQTGDAYILAMEYIEAMDNIGIIITKVDMFGNTISQEVVTPADDECAGTEWGASIAVGPNGEPHVMYRGKHKALIYFGYYSYKTESGWSTPVTIYEKLYRGWTPRIDVDQQGRAHIMYGYGEDESIFGHYYYVRIENGAQTAFKDGINYFRGDVNGEICCTPDGEVHLVTGNADYTRNGLIYYYNSLDGGTTWEGHGNIEDDDAAYACGFVDISEDAQKNIHICYSSENSKPHRTPGIWYAKFQNDVKTLDRLITVKDEISDEHLALGLSSVAASEDGQYVMIAYITGQDGGDLYTRLSSDGGETWGERELVASDLNAIEGRSRHILRAYRHRFYLMYPLRGIQFRTYQIPGFEGPVAEANGPYSAPEGSSIQFSAAGSSDPEGIAMYAWDWNNDGIFDDSTAAETINYIYTDDYNGQAILRARSNAGEMSTDNAAVTISNVAPTVSLGSDKIENEGTEIAFTATVNDPGTGDVLTYNWDFGDGTVSADVAPTHAFADNGTFTVTLTVQDDDGGQNQDPMTVTVNNVPPVANAGGSYNGRPDETVALQGSATDPGSADTFDYAWDLDGNGTFEHPNQNATVTYSVNGVYKVTLRVQDDDGGQDTDEASIIIGSAAPVISTIPAQTIDEGGAFTAIQLDNYVTDPDDPVDALTWLSEGNINLDVTISNRVATVSPPNSNWFGQETITFIAMDPGGEADSADVVFTVNSINDAPQVAGIPNQTKSEGTPFQAITLDNYVQDVDHNLTQMNWEYSGNTNLLVTITNRVASVAPADSEWAGNENITFKATDPENASGQASATFAITAVNDPPQVNNFPDQDFYQYSDFPEINLDETVYDPDHADNQLNWTFYGNANLNLVITNRVLKVTAKEASWHGSENVNFVVTDPANRQTTKTVKFTVNKVDARPVISQIEDQEIDEGGVFPVINFDNYIHDQNNTPAEISWSHYGQSELQVTWDNHNATVTTPGADWFGSETISFIATDPENLKDTTTVNFIVHEVNDPPVIAGISNITFAEDATYDLALSLLRQHSSDVDHDVNTLEFGLKNNVQVRWEYQPASNRLHIYATPDFSGVENVSLFAKDPGGAIGEQPLQITVTPSPDPVSAFEIVSPINESIFVYPPMKEYVWRAAIDPDSDDYVNYRWLLSRSEAFADTFNTAYVGADTVYNHHVSKTMWKGAYFWKVIALSSDGSMAESSVGRVSTLITDVEETVSAEIPKEFALLPNHPNPFNPETKITFHVPRESFVRVTVYNSLGQRVKALVNEQKSPGEYSLYWNATNELGNRVSSGIYICRLAAGDFSQYIKMILMQ